MAATGLPGTPNTSVSPRVPKASGLPGLVATPQNRRSTPELVLHLLDEVVVAHRDAARRDDHVVLERRGQQAPRLVQVVARDAQQDRVGAGGEHLAVRREGVGVADLPRLERPAGRDELAAGGEDRDARPARDAHALDADGGEQADLGGAEESAALEQDVTDGDVLAGAAHVRAGGGDGLDRHESAVDGRVLDLHDGVDARGQRRAGHDARRVAGRDRLGHVPARRDVDDHAELPAPALELRARDGEAVHGGVGEGRYLFGRDDALRGGAPERLEQRDLFGRAAGGPRPARRRGLRGC